MKLSNKPIWTAQWEVTPARGYKRVGERFARTRAQAEQAALEEAERNKDEPTDKVWIGKAVKEYTA